VTAFTLDDALQLVDSFNSGKDGLAQKSRELTLDLLRHTADPFSRSQFKPGHVTCTALVVHPWQPRVLVMHHHRLRRWLLPGGHVEKADPNLAYAAAREAREETDVHIDIHFEPRLAGIDVHGIPSKRGEPFHLHHDLIWALRAENENIAETDEAPKVLWAASRDWDRLQLADSIRNAILRAV
jgi:8-oxo-dGTP pyrophosphatase MutT (NUDIX family)